MLPGDNGQSLSKHQKMCESLMSVDTEEYNENLREKMNQQINSKRVEANLKLSAFLPEKDGSDAE